MSRSRADLSTDLRLLLADLELIQELHPDDPLRLAWGRRKVRLVREIEDLAGPLLSAVEARREG